MPVDRITPVVELLLEHGYMPAGSLEIPGGKIARIPGNRFVASTSSTRQRLAFGDRRVTVGKITTCFYRIDKSKPERNQAADFQNFKTKEIDTIKEYLEKGK